MILSALSEIWLPIHSELSGIFGAPKASSQPPNVMYMQSRVCILVVLFAFGKMICTPWQDRVGRDVCFGREELDDLDSLDAWWQMYKRVEWLHFQGCCMKYYGHIWGKAACLLYFRLFVDMQEGIIKHFFSFPSLKRWDNVEAILIITMCRSCLSQVGLFIKKIELIEVN